MLHPPNDNSVTTQTDEENKTVAEFLPQAGNESACWFVLTGM